MASWRNTFWWILESWRDLVSGTW